MASVGVHTNGSQFYITLDQCKHLNGRCVTFGRMIEGDEVLKSMESVSNNFFNLIYTFPVLHV
jgi:cyclophilin family peptidyl-prolyl cis-trans isomerase